MKKWILLLIPMMVLLSCENNCPNPDKFTYHSTNGKCQKCSGEEGYNTLDFQQIHTTKDAECTDLSKLNLVYLLDTAAIPNFQELGYNILQGYNFKGCKFDSSILFFNHIYGASFEGADLSTLQYGYAVITGKKDGYTLLPLSGSCLSLSDSCHCAQ